MIIINEGMSYLRAGIRKGILSLILCFIVPLLYAGSNDSIRYPELNKAYLKSYYYDTRDFVISPIKWKTKQWIEFGAVTGATAIAFTQDVNIWNYFTDHQNTTADNISKYVFEPFGNVKVSIIAIGSLYLGGRVAKDKRLAGTSLVAAKSLVVSAVFAEIVKHLTHRNYNDSTGLPEWDGPVSDSKYSSFPSGHATVAFSFASVFAMEYKSTIWIPALVYTLAAGTAVERLYSNDHWASDVVVGAALGFVTGRFMWKQSRKVNNRLLILPTASTRSASVTCLLRLSQPKRIKTGL
jgi:membrane-associated phospholipid phosphatase